MKVFELYRIQTLPISVEEAWGFFSCPTNLPEITPADMGFNILTPNLPSKIHAGLEIDYTVRPLLKIPVKWKTLISHVEEPKHFTDKQVNGPYKLWEHQHTFESFEGGVLMTDRISYALPFGILGQAMHALFIRKRLEEIFNYRNIKLKQLFPDRTSQSI